MQRTLRSLIQVAACLTFMVGVMAADADKKADPAGTWKWSRPGRGDAAAVEVTMKIKVEGDKITGKISQPGRQGNVQEVDIKDAKVKGDEITFSVTQERGGNSFTTKYAGKISGDAIKGTIERPGRDGGDPTKTPWEAKREKAK
jgi:preprotein translocase subunit SecD